MSTLLITGTDSGVGKTWIGRALGHALAAAGRRVVAIKPVETGCAGATASFEDGARRCLPPARDIVLATCVRGHERHFWLACVVVMPDHVHLIVTPYDHTNLPAVIGRIKGGSSLRRGRNTSRTIQSAKRLRNRSFMTYCKHLMGLKFSSNNGC